ncbi:MAG: flagellin [Oscillibacter sp.]|nr:flagellin [Oscillibacter sp.]
MRIQHNILAMNAYRNYNTNTSALAKNLEKLSSGYKINRAGDDAAGLAISEKMRAQITGLNAAQKNVKDGISLVKTAEGAMQEIQDMLNRMDYLATQSANGTYDNPVDRLNLNKEMEALKTEINRIADSANFNGINLLDGSLADTSVSSKDVTNLTVGTGSSVCSLAQLHKTVKAEQKPSFQIDLKQAVHGAIASASIAAGGTFAIKVSVGSASFTISMKVKNAVAASGVINANNVDFASATITNGVTNGVASLTSGNSSSAFKVELDKGVMKFSLSSTAAIKDFDSNMEVTITGSAVTFGTRVSYNCMTQNVVNGVKAQADQLAHGHINLTADVVNQLVNGAELKIGDQYISFDKESTGVDGQKIGIKDLLTDGKFVTEGSDGAKNIAELARRISVAAADNKAFTVGVGSSGASIALQEKFDYRKEGDESTYIDTQDQFNAHVGIAVGKETGTKKGLTLQIGDTSDDFNRLTVSVGDMHVNKMGVVDETTGQVSGKTIADINIKTPEAAKEAIDIIKGAINYVSGVRGDLGAVQNRLEHTANNLSVMAENIQDAESTIRDTDIAEEMMSYTKNNILVQSAQAMLAQANAVPQGVLQLLG